MTVTVLRFLLGSGQRHVETTRVVQEADALVFIGTDTRQDDEVLLSALEGVHAGNFHLLHGDKRGRLHSKYNGGADFVRCH